MSSVSGVIAPLRGTGSSQTSAASGCGSPAVSARRARPRPCRGPSCAAPRSAPPGCRASRRGAGRASPPRRALRSRRRTLRAADRGRRDAWAPRTAPRGTAGRIQSDRGEARRQAERVGPGRLAGREDLARVQRLGELERPADDFAFRRRESLCQRAERSGAACRMQLDNRDHAVFYGLWAGSPSGAQARAAEARPRRRALAAFHQGFVFLPQVPKLKELVCSFSPKNSSQARTAWKSPTRCE